MPIEINDYGEIIETERLPENHLLRSVEVTELISNKPGFLVRWGITILFFIAILLLAVTWFIRYPDIVVAAGYLNSINAPKEVITKSEGKLVKLFIKEGQEIKKDEVLGYMESTADHKEVIHLSVQLDTITSLIQSGKTEEILKFISVPFGKLGELQPAYQTYSQAFHQFATYLANGFYVRKRKMLNEDLGFLSAMHDALLQQKNMLSQDVLLSDSTFRANAILKDEKVISAFEYRTEKSKLLAKQMTVPQISSSIISNENQQHEKLKEIAELENQVQLQKSIFTQALNTFRSNVEEWKKRYLLIAPVTGKIAFAGFLQENQQLKAGQAVCYINPDNADYFIEARIPQYNFGKVKTGQQVLLKFSAYPFQEFGSVKGRIEIINNIPSDSGYLAKVSLPDGLVTNYKKELQYRTGLSVQANIITSNKRLLQRLTENLIKETSR